MNKQKKGRKSPAMPRANPFSHVLPEPVTRLSETDLAELKRHVKTSAHYAAHRLFFKKCDIDLLIELAAERHFIQPAKLEDRIQKATGYTRKGVESFRKRLRPIAAEIRRLNTVELPGGRTFTELIRDLGDLEVGPIDLEESIALADRFDNLPTFLQEYGEALKQWPHPRYRKHLSSRNWGTLHLVQICLLVKALTGEFHYEEVAGLLSAVKESTKPRLKGRRGKAVTPDQIRQNIKDFRLRNTRAYGQAESLARLAAERYNEDHGGNEIAGK